MQKAVLVTGGAGFIGSHLCEVLTAEPANQVWSLDDYSTGSVKNHIPGVKYLKGNTCDIGELVDFPIDVIYHLGEYSRVEQSFRDFDTVWSSNVAGTFAVLEFCRRHHCRLIYAGSSTKFGDNGAGPSQSPYGWTKARNTELVKSYGHWFSLDYAIAYFYNAYGPREITDGDYATLIGLFCKKMRCSEPLGVVSPGSQQRNFTHVSDIVAGLKLVGEHGEGDGYGIGHPDSYTVMDIAKMFGGQIEMLPPRPGNRLSASLITEKTMGLGWSAKREIGDYIEALRESGFKSELS